MVLVIFRAPSVSTGNSAKIKAVCVSVCLSVCLSDVKQKKQKTENNSTPNRTKLQCLTNKRRTIGSDTWRKMHFSASLCNEKKMRPTYAESLEQAMGPMPHSTCCLYALFHCVGVDARLLLREVQVSRAQPSLFFSQPDTVGLFVCSSNVVRFTEQLCVILRNPKL